MLLVAGNLDYLTAYLEAVKLFVGKLGDVAYLDGESCICKLVKCGCECAGKVNLVALSLDFSSDGCLKCFFCQG